MFSRRPRQTPRSAHPPRHLGVDIRPDVVLMDLRLPDSPGAQAIEQLALLAPASRILILTRTEHNRVIEVSSRRTIDTIQRRKNKNFRLAGVAGLQGGDQRDADLFDDRGGAVGGELGFGGGEVGGEWLVVEDGGGPV